MIGAHWSVRLTVGLGALGVGFILTSPLVEDYLVALPWVALFAITLGLGRTIALARRAAQRDRDPVSRFVVMSAGWFVVCVLASGFMTARMWSNDLSGISGPVGITFVTLWATHALLGWAAIMVIWNPTQLTMAQPEKYRNPWEFDPDSY